MTDSSHARYQQWVLPLAAITGIFLTIKLGTYLHKEKKRKESLVRLRYPSDYEEHAIKFGNPLGAIYFGYTSAIGETLRGCKESFKKLKLVPRAMQGVDSDPSISYFGRQVNAPLIIAPTALHNLADSQGEVSMARGAGKAGVLYCYNYFLSSQPIEKVVQEEGEKWLHLYLFSERNLVEFAIEEALEKYKGSFSAVIVTCDHPHNRVRDTVLPYFRRMWSYALPNSLSAPYMPNIARAAGVHPAPTSADVMTSPDITRTVSGTNDATLTWNDLMWLKKKINGRVPLVAKGILDPRDALAAVEHGADAVVVSNHGGRQTDGSITAIDALPGVIAALKKSHPQTLVFCDTGVRTSCDVIRIMALGAAGALIGRPPLFALMCGGSPMLTQMLSQWRDDIRDDMKCLGWERWTTMPDGVLAK